MSFLPQLEVADIDQHFANFIARFGGDAKLIPLAAVMLSRSIREKHICLSLRSAPASPDEIGGTSLLEWPDAKAWRAALARSKAIGGPDAQTPIVLDESDRLYLRRYWNYQRSLASALLKKAIGNQPIKRDKAGTQEGAIDSAVTNALRLTLDIASTVGRVGTEAGSVRVCPIKMLR